MNAQTQDINAFNPFSGPKIDRVIRTTRAQSELLIDCTLGGDDANRAYNISYSLQLTGDLNQDLLEKAIQSLIHRHESLRASFNEDGHYMLIFRERPINITFKDLSKLSASNKETSKDSLIKDDASHTFDVINGPLFKASLLQLEAKEHILVLTFHHTICDGLSVDTVLKELGILYSAYAQETTPNLPEPLKYSVFAEKENRFTHTEAYKQAESYWLNMYRESVPKVELPLDYVRPNVRTYNNAKLYYKLDNTRFETLKQTGIKNGCSIVTSFLGAFEIFLHQQTGQNDLVVGLSTSRHAHYNMMGMIGHCVNMLPLRSALDGNLSFKAYLKQRKSQVFDAYEHQSISFGHLLQKIAIPRDPSRIPLAPVMMNIEFGNALENEFSFFGLSHELIHNPKPYGTFEIEVQAFMSKEGPYLRLHYNTTLFKEETIKQMMASFEALLENLVAQPDTAISEIISADYLNSYQTLNATQVAYPSQPLHELLRAQAELYPDDIALEFNDTKTSFLNLQKNTNQLAHYLVKEGVKPGDFVCISLPSSPELLYVIIAILQCGAAYIPLDPKYPQSRLEYMLTDSKAKFLITNKLLSNTFPKSTHQLLIEDAFTQISKFPTTPVPITVSQDNLAYLLYTSGSTGKPKGVKVTHKNLVNFLNSMASKPGINKNDRLLSITTISFDIAGLELFLPLLTGATLVLADNNTSQDARILINVLKTKNISIMQATPTTWKMLLDSGWEQPKLLKALCGGEALPLDLAKALGSKCHELWNMYGPTETTIWSTIKQIDRDDDVITIGKPIANTQIYIINDAGQLMPPGNIGEIGIGGDGVTEGYWQRPELTSEKFIKNTFSAPPNDILYRTGDLGKLLPNGDILCLGRLDHQVKIRGHRIELGEIEQTFSGIPSIQSVAVLGHEDALVAFVIPKKTIDNDDVNETIHNWISYLKERLPEILVPQDIRLVSSFPTTPNGKLDRQALLQTEALKIASRTVGAAPRTASEHLVADIWKDYLNVDSIDITSNFFELGGHSLIALRIMNRLEKESGIRLPLSSLFEYSTIETFSKLLNKNTQDNVTSWSSLVPIKQKGTKTPIYIVHGAGMEVLIFNTLAQNLDDNQPVYGLQAVELFKQEGNKYQTIEAIAEHYVNTIMVNNPNGPYALAGYSFGGIIAFEMAKQLKAKNKTINMIGLFDTVIESHFKYKSKFRKQLAGFAYRTKRRATFFAEMLSSYSKLKHHVQRKKQFITDYYIKPKTFRTQEDKLKFEYFLETERIIQPIKQRYQLIPQEVEVDLFRATGEKSYKNDATFLGWNKYALEGVAVHNIPGNHIDMFSSPNIEEMGRVFQQVLDKRNGNT